MYKVISYSIRDIELQLATEIKFHIASQNWDIQLQSL